MDSAWETIDLITFIYYPFAVEVHVCPQLEMATVLPTTMDVSTIPVDTPINPPKDLDAGALLVLKSKGKQTAYRGSSYDQF